MWHQRLLVTTPRQEVSHSAVVPGPAARGANATMIQRRSEATQAGDAAGLELARHRQHIGGKGVSGLPEDRASVVI